MARSFLNGLLATFLTASGTVRGADFELTNVNGSYAINATFNGGWKYIANGPAFLLNADGTNGGATYYTAVSGTAGAAISFVQQAYVSPSGFQFSNNPTVPTQSAGNNSTRIASTAYVDSALGAKISRAIINTSGNYTLGAVALTDYVYNVTAAHTGTMPTASGNTSRYTVKNKHTSSVAINPNASDTFFGDVAGLTSIDLSPGQSVELISNGTSEWGVY